MFDLMAANKFSQICVFSNVNLKRFGYRLSSCILIAALTNRVLRVLPHLLERFVRRVAIVNRPK